MLRPMQAMAKTTTSIAVRSGRPATSSANGSTASEATATARGQDSVRMEDSSCLLEFLDALAEQPARAYQQHQRHQQIDRGFAGRRIEEDRDAADDADQHRSRDHAP